MFYTTHRHSAESINHYIGLTRMVKHIHVIVIKELKTSPLMKIKLFMGEHISESLMIVEHINTKII